MHVTAKSVCSHFATMMNFLCPPSFLLSSFHSCCFFFLTSLSVTLSVTNPSISPPLTIQSSLLVWLLCVLAGHSKYLQPNQSELGPGWKTSHLLHVGHLIWTQVDRKFVRLRMTEFPASANRHCATLAKDHRRQGFSRVVM